MKSANTLAQEGEQPAGDPIELLHEPEAEYARLEGLISATPVLLKSFRDVFMLITGCRFRAGRSGELDMRKARPIPAALNL